VNSVCACVIRDRNKEVGSRQGMCSFSVERICLRLILGQYVDSLLLWDLGEDAATVDRIFQRISQALAEEV
jgi:hypothetical protein